MNVMNEEKEMRESKNVLVNQLANMTSNEIKELAEDLAWYTPAACELIEFHLGVALHIRREELELQDQRAWAF